MRIDFLKNRKMHGKQSRLRLRAQHGFTLVELLLVLVILALIGGLVLPGIIGKAEGAKAKAAVSQVSRLAMAVESYYLDTGSTPDSLEQLVTQSGDVIERRNPGPTGKPGAVDDKPNRQRVEYLAVNYGEQVFPLLRPHAVCGFLRAK